LTFCFKLTTLVYAPCGFLWLFSLLDYSRRKRSRYSDIPWSLLNVSRAIALFLLISIVCVEVSVLVSVREEINIFDAQFVAVGIKIATFVS
jgi:ATP-binding cassette, subfamily C (CFTR/MRP), member 1